jgi:signal transduction histidine kinase
MLSAAVFVPAVIMVAVLALLQYRWSNQVSEATSLRLADSLQMSMIDWHQDLFRDFSQICFVFTLSGDDSMPLDSPRFGRSLSDWKSAAPYPDLISNLYIAGADKSGPELLHFNPSTTHLDPQEWPAALGPIRDALSPTAAHPPVLVRQRRLSNVFYPGGQMSGWQFEPSVPALLHPITISNGDRPDVHHWIVIQLNDNVLRNKMMPDLAQRYFQGASGLDYQIAVVGGEPRKTLYSSDRGFGSGKVADADGTMNIFGRDQNNLLESPTHMFHYTLQDRGPESALDVIWFPLFSDTPRDEDWQLVVRHRTGGPLGAFTAEMHQRDLSLSFGILVLLVLSMGMLLISTRRAQHLARLQMEFVTTISHELRTPLTVIGTAADNITRGVVAGKQQIAQYGALIQAQTRQLTSLVEQVLLFAATRQGRQWHNFHPLDVSDVIQSALGNTADLASSSQFTVEREIEPNLPPVVGDSSALSQCLQNLINNALKYGKKEKWVGIRARFDTAANEIEISVSDRGIGISPADMPHIFEPFYRGSSVIAEQVRGTGLGLALAKSIAEAMKGRLTVVSTLGKGSVFTLRLPCTVQAGEVSKSDAA